METAKDQFRSTVVRFLYWPLLVDCARTISLTGTRQANDNLHGGSLADNQLPGPCPRGRGHQDHHHRATGVGRHGLATVVRLAEVSTCCNAIYQARCHARCAQRHGLGGTSGPNALVPESQLERRGSEYRARGDTWNETSAFRAATDVCDHQDR